MHGDRRPGRAGALLRLWRDTADGRTMVGAGLSLGTTLCFALYHGALGIGHASVWHGGIGVFYLLLSVIRGGGLAAERWGRAQPKAVRDRCHRRAFLMGAVLLMALDLALILPIAMMVVLARPVTMGLIPAIAMATYTAYKVPMAFLRVHRQRRSQGGAALLVQLRTVDLIDALVSILTLQNTLIMVNGGDAGTNSMLPLSATSSAVIYAMIVGISVRMLCRGIQQIRI